MYICSTADIVIHFYTLSFTFIYFYPLSSTLIHFHPFSSTIIHSHPFYSISSTFVHFHPISSTFVHFHPLPSILSTFIHQGACLGMHWSVSDHYRMLLKAETYNWDGLVGNICMLVCLEHCSGFKNMGQAKIL